MNNKLLRLLGMTPDLLREMDRADAMLKEHDRAMDQLRALAPNISAVEDMERLGASKVADLLPAYMKASEQFSKLQSSLGAGMSDKVRDQLAQGIYRMSPLGADLLGQQEKIREQFEALSGSADFQAQMEKVARSAGLAMDSSALQLIRDQRGLIDPQVFGGVLESFSKMESLANAIDTDWGVPAWRPSFERLANISLARDIGVWRSRTPGSPPPNEAEQEFVQLRSDQAEDDAALLDDLVLELMPSLRQHVVGARSVLEKRSTDYRTHFGASARKAIDLTMDEMAPRADVDEWMQSDPAAPTREKGRRKGVSFRERVAFVFRNAPEPARAFFLDNIDSIVVLRDELSRLDHGVREDPHSQLAENRQLVERLLLQIFQERRRSR